MPAKVASLKPGIGKGVLLPRGINHKFSHRRFSPRTALAPFVEHLWTVSWDLRAHEPYVQETLPYPSFHLVFEPGRSAIWGAMTGRFSRTLEGQGRVFGVKFHPGGFYPLLKNGERASDWTDAQRPITSVFDVDVPSLEEMVFSSPDEEKMAETIEDFLCSRIPPPDPTVALLRRLVDTIKNDRDLLKVSDLAPLTLMSPRGLQRTFARYVGVSPKAVIQRFRLHEASSALEKDEAIQCADLAQQLGYADQAHFIRDFKRLVGATPAEYQRRSRAI